MNITSDPFAVQTPEDISAADTVELFVDVFADFKRVPKPGHTFLNGPRGSGKSMMFRFMLPDCQELKQEKPLREHEYFSIYVPIKQTSLNIVDLERVQRHANLLLNEHLLVTYIATRAFNSIAQVVTSGEYDSPEVRQEARDFYKLFTRKAQESGYNKKIEPLPVEISTAAIFEEIETLCFSLKNDVDQYVRSISFSEEPIRYNDSICVYLDFLFPLLDRLRQLSFMPGGPVFLLIDDADNLSDIQTVILNTWVSYRTSARVSLKISTQLNYSTFRTSSGITIDSPHDFNEVNIATLYTSQKDHYKDRMCAIVEKRLRNAGFPVSAYDFFPDDKTQTNKIDAIYDKIKSGEIVTPDGYRATDKGYRYASSEYLKTLGGASKSRMTFLYAGFRDMVDISSGIIRHFLELASRMYSAEKANIEKVAKLKGQEPRQVLSIDPATQSKVIRNYSEEYLHEDLDKLVNDDSSDAGNAVKLRNLINSMGGMFEVILFSDASTRRIISIALTNTPEPDILEVLKLGVRYGYLQESTVGNREGTGRTRRYTLSRRLAPSFNLIAESFAGDKFITNTDLRAAMKDHKSFVTKFKTKGWLGEATTRKASGQHSLFDGEGNE
ncbi:hypothetical protein SAMN02745146_3063 [Hymenobacter daecheongensis DSM 21074]|uniref:Uncharacterized protein n=1 Tax=Hymenobacter daecheongensis DSM 21074 TaxID=1121955 RepID=A0A1M6J1Z8_9BACT|nr:hypothetical protein [Hymenobacter daecheongensis]SHJ40763.1 hypothetical protein SAMN02745146_3063 [Hymenobacter daecheongensis DSM 21074]